jgi:uncharacterized protein (DUF433 family)
LSHGEKVLVLQWIAAELGGAVPGIDTDPAVCGGEACVARPRAPLCLLFEARRLGTSEGDVLEAYPAPGAQDLANVSAFT